MSNKFYYLNILSIYVTFKAVLVRFNALCVFAEYWESIISVTFLCVLRFAGNHIHK